MGINEKVKNFFKANVGYFVVFGVSLAYIATSFIAIDATGKTISQIIVDGSVSLVLGFCINTVFGFQGMLNGEKDERVIQTVALHGQTVSEIASCLDRLDDWCEMMNRENYKTIRTRILASAGLYYSDCFDENGVAKPYVGKFVSKTDKMEYLQEKRRKKAYRHAVKLKLTPLTANVLTSEGGKASDPYYLGKTKREYQAKTSIMGLASKIGIAIFAGYYGFDFISTLDFGDLIWRILQIAVFVVMGVIKMFKAQMFITDEYRGRIIKKIDHLQKFECYIKNGGQNNAS